MLVETAAILLGGAGVLLSAGGLAIWVSGRVRPNSDALDSKRVRQWAEAMRKSRLRVSRMDANGLIATDEGLELRVTRQPDGAFTVDVVGIESRFGFARRPDWEPPSSFRSGDRRFDNAVKLTGDPMAAAACLDRGTRRVVRRFLKQNHTLKLDQGHLSFTAGNPGGDALIATLKLNRLRLSIRTDIDRIRTSYDEEPEPRVRKQLVSAALRGEMGPDKMDLAREALGDRDPLVRMLVATRLGSEGRSVLRKTFRSAYQESDIEVLSAALSGMRKTRDTKSVSLVRKMLTRDREMWDRDGRRIAFAVERALRLLGVLDPDVEEIALEVLAWETQAHQESAVSILAKRGTVHAVPALQVLTQRGLGILPGKLAREAASAITEIQSRAGGERGGLSVAGNGPSDGQLALAGQQGELSPTDEVPLDD